VVAVGVGVQVDRVGVEAAGGVAGDLRGLGGVFGEVGGDHAVGDVSVGGDGDDAYVDLLAPVDAPPRPSGPGGGRS
jgi:hypothetical protein